MCRQPYSIPTPLSRTSGGSFGRVPLGGMALPVAEVEELAVEVHESFAEVEEERGLADTRGPRPRRAARRTHRTSGCRPSRPQECPSPLHASPLPPGSASVPDVGRRCPAAESQRRIPTRSWSAESPAPPPPPASPGWRCRTRDRRGTSRNGPQGVPDGRRHPVDRVPPRCAASVNVDLLARRLRMSLDQSDRGSMPRRLGGLAWAGSSRSDSHAGCAACCVRHLLLVAVSVDVPSLPLRPPSRRAAKITSFG